MAEVLETIMNCDRCRFFNRCSMKRKEETDFGYTCISFEDVEIDDESDDTGMIWEDDVGLVWSGIENIDDNWNEMSYTRLCDNCLDTELSEYESWEW